MLQLFDHLDEWLLYSSSWRQSLTTVDTSCCIFLFRPKSTLLLHYCTMHISCLYLGGREWANSEATVNSWRHFSKSNYKRTRQQTKERWQWSVQLGHAHFKLRRNFTAHWFVTICVPLSREKEFFDCQATWQRSKWRRVYIATTSASPFFKMKHLHKQHKEHSP